MSIGIKQKNNKYNAFSQVDEAKLTNISAFSKLKKSKNKYYIKWNIVIPYSNFYFVIQALFMSFPTNKLIFCLVMNSILFHFIFKKRGSKIWLAFDKIRENLRNAIFHIFYLVFMYLHIFYNIIMGAFRFFIYLMVEYKINI